MEEINGITREEAPDFMAPALGAGERRVVSPKNDVYFHLTKKAKERVYELAAVDRSDAILFAWLERHWLELKAQSPAAAPEPANPFLRTSVRHTVVGRIERLEQARGGIEVRVHDDGAACGISVYERAGTAEIWLQHFELKRLIAVLQQIDAAFDKAGSE